MLNEDRIRLMTQMAVYEQNEGKEYIPMCQYYRKDYVGYQMIKTFICSTIAFGILFLLLILYELDIWLERLYQADFIQYGLTILVAYIIFVVIYQIIACVIYNIRYAKGHKSIRQFQAKLKKVEKLFEREERLHPGKDWDA